METKDDKYNILIGKLRHIKPEADNPQEVTEKIMYALRKRKTKPFTKIIILVRPWVSAAAIFLIVLYFYQSTDVPIQETSSVLVTRTQESSKIKNCMTEIAKDQIDRTTLLNRLLCYRRQLEQKSKITEQLFMKYQQKFNINHHENIE